MGGAADQSIGSGGMSGEANAPVGRTAAEPVRNLVIVHSPGYEDISDWTEVKRRIEEQAPDIEVRIVNNFAPNSATARWQVKRPSLVFSASHLAVFSPKGGTVYAGRQMGKFQQVQRMAHKGIPVPRTVRLAREALPMLAGLGRYAVVKPEGSGKGQGIRLVEPQGIAALYDELTMAGRRGMIVQAYIEHSVDGYPTEYRVLTLFGRVLYAARNRWAKPRPTLAEIAADPEGVIASNDRRFERVRKLIDDADVIALGERAHAAFPECAVLGVDIVRETGTGKLYVMETNPEGLTWHFSSSLSKRTYRTEYVQEMYAQFGALDRIARLLIDKVRAEAA
jgi:hypothetical protein